MVPFIKIIIPLLLVSGCATIKLSEKFNPDEIAWSKNVGFNEVAGTVTYYSKDKKIIKQCDGTLPVVLVPYSRYAENKIEILANKKISNYEKIYFDEDFFKRKIINDDKEAEKYIFQTNCLAGLFHFSGIPDGKWILITYVIIQRQPISGYFFVTKVDVAENKTFIVTNEVTEGE